MKKTVNYTNPRIRCFLFVIATLFVASCTKKQSIKDEAELSNFLSGKSLEVIRNSPIGSNSNGYYDGLYPSEGFVSSWTSNPTDTVNWKTRIYFKNNECGIMYSNFIGYPTSYKIYKMQNSETKKLNSDPYYYSLKTVINDCDSLEIIFDMYGQCLFAESKIFDVTVNEAFQRYYTATYPTVAMEPFDNYSKELKWLNYRKVTRVNLKFDNSHSSYDWNIKDPRMVPEKIEYDGYPDAEYRVNDQIVALSDWKETDPEGVYIRMQFKGKETSLKLIKEESDSIKEVFANDNFRVSFTTKRYGECAGEGQQYIFGDVVIELNGKQNVLEFKSTTSNCQDPKCKEIGNGL